MKTLTLHKPFSLFAITAVASMLSFHTLADEATASQKNEHKALEIEFVEPKDFTDIRPSNQSRSKFREHVLSSIEGYFAELSDTLPEGQKLVVSVLDIDLAGDTRSPRIPIGSTMHDIRVLEDIYFPRIKFSYELKDASGELIKSDEVNLKDMAYLNRAGFVRNTRDAFPYERQMLKEWFEETFSDA